MLCIFFSDEEFVLFSCSFETDIDTCSIDNYGAMKWKRDSVCLLFTYCFSFMCFCNQINIYAWKLIYFNLSLKWKKHILFSTTIFVPFLFMINRVMIIYRIFLHMNCHSIVIIQGFKIILLKNCNFKSAL